MSDPRLSSPSSIRLVAAAAAAVASLGVVALGVQLGTSGLVGDGPGRNPGSSSATAASATVDLPRSRPGPSLEGQLIALVPALGSAALGSSPSAGASLASSPTGQAAPAGPADGSGSEPAPSPVPSAPIPTPETPGAPAPTLPAPTPTIPPALDPVVDPIDDAISGLGGGESSTENDSTPPAPAPTTTLEGLIRLLVGT